MLLMLTRFLPYLIIGLFCLLLTYSCAGPGSSESDPDGFVATPTDGKITNADIIRNPVSADKPTDTVNVAKLTFDRTAVDFGTIRQGEVVKETYRFTNTGRIPLVISDARSTCGCTVPDWPKTPIAPGAEGEISVRFDSENREGRQGKPVTITANTYPSATTLYLNGTVLTD